MVERLVVKKGGQPALVVGIGPAASVGGVEVELHPGEHPGPVERLALVKSRSQRTGLSQRGHDPSQRVAAMSVALSRSSTIAGSLAAPWATAMSALLVENSARLHWANAPSLRCGSGSSSIRASSAHTIAPLEPKVAYTVGAKRNEDDDDCTAAGLSDRRRVRADLLAREHGPAAFRVWA